jgi:hypothetical protein
MWVHYKHFQRSLAPRVRGSPHQDQFESSVILRPSMATLGSPRIRCCSSSTLEVRTYCAIDAGSGAIPDRISVKAYALANSASGARTENIGHDSFWSSLGAANGVICGGDSLASTVSRLYSRSLEATLQLLCFGRVDRPDRALGLASRLSLRRRSVS